MKRVFSKTVTAVMLISAMLAVFSCKHKDVKKIMVHNEFALSLFSDSIYIDELFDKMDSSTVNWLRVNEDGTLSAFYHDSIKGLVDAYDFLSNVEDVDFDESGTFNVNTVAPQPEPGTVTDSASYSVSIPFSYDGYSIERAVLSKGEFSMTISINPVMSEVKKIVLKSTSITMATGEHFVLDFYPASNDVTRTVDLAGCTIQVDDDSTIPFDGEVFIEYSAQSGVSGGEYQARLTGYINDLGFKQLTGVLNLDPFEFNDKTPIDYGIDGLVGSMTLPTPNMTLSYRNTFSCGAECNVNLLNFYSSVKNDTVDLLGPGNDVDITLNPTNNEYVDEPVTGFTEYIDALGEYTELNFGGSLSLNTGSTVTVTDESKIDLAIGVELPLEFNISDVCFRDTIDFSASGDNNFEDYLDEIDFFLDFNNHLPLTVTVETELLNDGEHSVWLFKDDASHSNTIVSEGASTLTCVMRDDDLERVLEADQIVLHLTVSTEGMVHLNVEDFIHVGIRMLTKTEDIEIDK